MALFSRIYPASSTRTLQRFCATSLFALGAVLGSPWLGSDAVAGFQWVAPIEKAPTPVVPPAAPVDGSVMPSPMQLPAVVPDTAAPSSPIPGIAPPVSAPIAATPPSAAEMVDGFGHDIPLTVALKQILPPSYGFALDGVDGGMLVSWEGGKAWYHVLDDMLTKSKLYGREEGQIIKISQAKMRDTASGVAAKEPPVIVPPMPVLDNKQPVQKIETTPPTMMAGAKGIEPLMVPPAVPSAVKADVAAIQADAEPALPPIPQGELVAPNATMMPQLQPTAAEMWRAEPGDHLHAVIKKWCARANVELVWSSEYDYPIQASVNFSGSFEDAVRGLLTGFVEAKPQPHGRLHDNPAVGQRTLVIEARGNTNSD